MVCAESLGRVIPSGEHRRVLPAQRGTGLLLPAVFVIQLFLFLQQTPPNSLNQNWANQEFVSKQAAQLVPDTWM